MNQEIKIIKNEKATKYIEVNNISFKNIGKNTFLNKDNLVFIKGEGSLDEKYFAQSSKIKDKQNIIIQEELTPLKESKGHRLIIQIENSISGKIYFFYLYQKRK